MSHFALPALRSATLVSLLLVGAAGAAPQPGSGDPSALPAPVPRGEIAAGGAPGWGRAGTTAEARALIATAPADPQGYLDLAAVAWRAGDVAGAIRALEEGRQKAAPSARLLVALGEAYVAANRLADAEETTRAALVHDAAAPGAQLQLGRIYELVGWPESAVECYEKAVAQSPQDVAAQCALVGGLVAVGRAAAAEKLGRECVAARDDADLWVALGEAQEAQEALRDAFNTYGRALVASPAHAGAHARRGRLYCRFGQFDAAATECRAALAADPGCALAHAYLGIAYSYQGQAEAAREHALRAQQAGYQMDHVWKKLAQ